MAAVETLTITRMPDGGFQVQEQEPSAQQTPGQEDPPIDQVVQTPDEVLQLVQQFLGETEAGAPDEQQDPSSQAAQAWEAEASKRDPASGLRM